MRKFAIAAGLVLLVLAAGATLAGVAVRDRVYDPVEALAYFLIAAERGSSHGARNRDRVLGDLDTNDFAFARQRSRDLAAEYPLAQ